jgi:tetratricopeptide (TPR) repeat protein
MSETSTPGNPFADSPLLSSESSPVGVLGFLGNRDDYHYKVVEVRRGGMGEVYICELVTNRGEKSVRCALKSFQKRLFFDRATRQAFLREVAVWARITGQPHIMPLLGLEQLDHRPFVRMIEVRRGQHGETTVRDLLRTGALPPDLVLRIACQTATGMQCASERVPGLVHGDLKPENLLLIGGNVYVSDFGLARAAAAAGDDTVLESTWAYRAPELWEGDQPTAAADIYAFGIMLMELLTGHLPLQAASRAEWARIHREDTPISATGLSREGLTNALAELALRCLTKNPAKRPESFAFLRRALAAAGDEHDALTTLMTMMESYEQTVWLKKACKGLRPAIVRTLSELDEHNLALEELNAIPTEEYDAELWTLRGRTLSLSGRDEEALACFDHALAADPDVSLRIACRSEYALSLKRLRRFDEAVRVYKDLLLVAPDEELPRIVINLATVHLTNEQPEAAVSLLIPFVKKQPDFPEAWGNLGIAHRGVGQYEEAAQCFRRAMSLAPDDPGHQVLYAELCMDDLGRIEEAAALLDQVFDQGYMSRNWLVRFLACNLVLGRENVVRNLTAAAKRDLSVEEFGSVQSDAIAYSKKIVEAATSPKSRSAEKPNKPPPATEKMQLQSNVADVPAATDIADTEQESGFKMPFINYRFYNFESFSIDFYYTTDAPDFIPIFQREYRRATREVATVAAGDCGLRPTLFFFTQCPGCGLLILTNRDHGKKLACRACDAAHESAPMQRADLATLLDQVEESVERKQMRFVRPVHALLIQPLDSAKSSIAEKVCTEAGFARVSENSTLASNLCMSAYERRMLKRGQPFSVWQKEFPAGPRVALEATPREIEDLVSDLRSACGGVVSLSMSFDAADQSPLTKMLMGKYDELEEYHRRAVREQPYDLHALLALIEFLVNRGKLDEALPKARAAVERDRNNAQTWQTLGRIELRREQWASAADAFERALALDPVDPTVLLMLAHCYDRLGDSEKAAGCATRARALGGHPILYS